LLQLNGEDLSKNEEDVIFDTNKHAPQKEQPKCPLEFVIFRPNEDSFAKTVAL